MGFRKKKNSKKDARLVNSEEYSFQFCFCGAVHSPCYVKPAVHLTFTHKNNKCFVLQIKEQLFPFQLFIAEETIKPFQSD